MRFSKSSLVCGTVSLLLPVLAIAEIGKEELTIVDCGGTPRAVEHVVESQTRDVRAFFSGSEGATVALTKSDGEALSAVVKNGMATFSPVNPGFWTLCPATGSISKVSLIENYQAGATESTLLTVGGIGASAGAIVALSQGNRNGSSSENAPVFTTSSSSNTSSSTASTGAKKPSSSSSSDYCVACARANGRDCLNDEVATPISVFK